MAAGASRSGVTDRVVGNSTAGGRRPDDNGLCAGKGKGAPMMTLANLCTWSRKALRDGGPGGCGRDRGAGSPERPNTMRDRGSDGRRQEGNGQGTGEGESADMTPARPRTRSKKRNNNSQKLIT